MIATASIISPVVNRRRLLRKILVLMLIRQRTKMKKTVVGEALVADEAQVWSLKTEDCGMFLR